MLPLRSIAFVPGTRSLQFACCSARLSLRVRLGREAVRSLSYTRMMAGDNDLKTKLQNLYDYSACDVSDALLKLHKPEYGEVARAGYLADIAPFALGKSKAPEDHPKVVATASTLQLIEKTSLETIPDGSPNAVPKGQHWVDMTEADTIVVIAQPEGQHCAAIGGIMAQRMKLNGVKGCVVGGRVRDIAELRNSELPVFALGKSTVGTAAESRVYARNIPVSIMGVTVEAGDVVFCDPLEGVVVFPQHMLDDVISLMPNLVAADDKVKDAVLKGMTVAEAFKKFRN